MNQARLPGAASLLWGLAELGASTLRVLTAIGSLVRFAGRTLWAIVSPPWFVSPFGRQLIAIGYLSLPVVALTAVFTGAALALNIFTGGGRFNAGQVLPQIVALGISRELGPVLTALMLAGRVSAAIAAEIGAMRATEQIDAMHTLSTDPFRYLMAPRLLAAVVVAPLLTLVADCLGIAGGWLVAVQALKLDGIAYLRNTAAFLSAWDVGSGLLKATVFGAIVALVGCYHGDRARGGARGVGQATTHAVVSAAVLIFASDYVLTALISGR